MNHRRIVLPPLLTLLLLAIPATGWGGPARSCLHIERVAAFTPRGEVYVEVKHACDEEDFDQEDPIISHLEMLVSDLPAVSQDVIVYRGEPRRAKTFVFRDLRFQTGDALLVRMMRFGEVQSLQIIKAP